MRVQTEGWEKNACIQCLYWLKVASQPASRFATLLLSLSCETTLLVSMPWDLSTWDGNQERRTGWDGRPYTKEEILQYYSTKEEILKYYSTDAQSMWDDLPHSSYQLASYQQSQSSAQPWAEIVISSLSGSSHLTDADDTSGVWRRSGWSLADGVWRKADEANVAIPTTIDAPQLDASQSSPEQPRASLSPLRLTGLLTLRKIPGEPGKAGHPRHRQRGVSPRA